MKVKPKQLAPMADFINDSYDGDLATARNDLNKAVYMLHYMDKGAVPELEFYNVCFAFHKMRQGFFVAHNR